MQRTSIKRQDCLSDLSLSICFVKTGITTSYSVLSSTIILLLIWFTSVFLAHLSCNQVSSIICCHLCHLAQGRSSMTNAIINCHILRIDILFAFGCVQNLVTVRYIIKMISIPVSCTSHKHSLIKETLYVSFFWRHREHMDNT